MKMLRMMTTSVNLFKHYGVKGFIKGVLNKLNGRPLLYGVQLKNRDNAANLQITRKLKTALKLLQQFGVKGLLRGIANKLSGKDLLEGICYTSTGEMNFVADIQQMGMSMSGPSLFTVSQYLLKEPYRDALKIVHSCTIVIPVYNGMQHLKRLLPSVEENTPDNINVLLVNDGSPDKEIVPFLKTFVNKHPNWEMMENPKNYGFVKTVNRGMAKVKTDYAILLNTDTVVPENWIPKMLLPFYENDKVASTTPFTNAGVYFSFPTFGYDNEPKWDIQKLNEAFSYVASNEYALNEIPSGTGFCMGINMACWRKIGGLDYKNFGKGYGEENDWCFRAMREGWRHLLVPNLFVHHYHGGSFF